MASPVTMTVLIRSFPTSSQTRCGSNLATRTIFEPTNPPPITDHWVAPCMRGAIGSWVMGPEARPLATMSSGRSTRVLVSGSVPPPRA